MLQEVTATMSVVGEPGDLEAFLNDQEPITETLRSYGLKVNEGVNLNSDHPDEDEYRLNDYFGARVRPSVSAGVTVEVETVGGKMFVTINVDEYKRPFEIFLRVGKCGEVEHAHLEGLARMVSYCLRIGGDPEGVVEHLKGITSEPVWYKGVLIRSAEDGVAYAMRGLLDGQYDEQLDILLGRLGYEPESPMPTEMIVEEEEIIEPFDL